MSRWVPKVYAGIGYDYAAIFEPDFCQRCNGLMLRSGEVLREVYCAAFPTPGVIRELLTRASGDALLFLHHPVDLEVSGVGFLPIPPDCLELLKARGVSIYACHAPMDCHDQIGTTAAIVQAFGVTVERSFAPYGRGFAGRIGVIDELSADALAGKGRRVFGVERTEIGGGRPAAISRVAIVAGGGDEVELFREAQRWGAQAFITGEWYTRTRPRDEEGRRWAQANRAACRAYADSSQMAFLGFSHAASEYLVMRQQMASYFEQQGLRVRCLAQSDWWR